MNVRCAKCLLSRIRIVRISHLSGTLGSALKKEYSVCASSRAESVDFRAFFPVRCPIRGFANEVAGQGIKSEDSGASLNESIDTEGSDKSTPFSEVRRDENVKELLEDAASFQDEAKDPNDVWSTPVYPVEADPRRDQTRHSLRPKVDPSKTSVIMFPGQGTQYVGMGRDLLEYPNVKDLFESASQILGYDLLDLCLNGPQEKLDQTIYSQPAVLVTSLAAVEKLRDERPWAIENCVATAGFSVGEITSYVFSGAITFEEAVRLVKVRAEAMQAASDLHPGGMMTIFYAADAKINYACLAAREWCKRNGVEDPECTVANFLFPQCKVIGGSEMALEFLCDNGKEFGIKRYKRLHVSGAFHTKLMRPAQYAFNQALDKAKIDPPLIMVHCNYDGKSYSGPNNIRKMLARQLCSPVKWEQTLHTLYERPPDTPFPSTYECGPGKMLKSIMQKVNAKAADATFNILA